MANPIDSLYFITIQSDQIGELRFEMDGERLEPFEFSTSRLLEISNVANAHYGMIKAPILLKPVEETGIYKIIEDQHVVIIRNNEKYDVTGKRLTTGD